MKLCLLVVRTYFVQQAVRQYKPLVVAYIEIVEPYIVDSASFGLGPVVHLVIVEVLMVMGVVEHP